MKHEKCKFCKHSKNDHELRRIIEKGVIVNRWYGPCEWDNCQCEIFESVEQGPYDFKNPGPKEEYLKSSGQSTRKIHVCIKCGRGFTKSRSLSSHRPHCDGVMKRDEEKAHEKLKEFF